jgi:hypothetical protein
MPQIDLLGILIAIIGAVTVVLASNASDSRLGHDELLKAISQTSFIVYSSIYVAGAIVLATLSEGRIGRTWVFVDTGLCALFGLFSHGITFNYLYCISGGFTVLSTKALSTLLTLEWIDIFTKWITYPLIAVCSTDKLQKVSILIFFIDTCLHWCWPNPLLESSADAI